MSNPNRPKFATKRLRKIWQVCVDKIIRTDITKGIKQINAVDDALTKRDEHIRKGDKITKKGKIIKKK